MKLQPDAQRQARTARGLIDLSLRAVGEAVNRCARSVQRRCVRLAHLQQRLEAPHLAYPTKSGARAMAVNALCELDAPGEYYVRE